MHFGQYSYLATTIIFAVGAVVFEWILGYNTLIKYKRLIGVVVIIGLVATMVAESIALSWQIWEYNPERTFNKLLFGAEIETYFYAIFVSLAVVSATLAWARYEERGMSLVKTTMVKLGEKFNEWREKSATN